MTPASPYPSRGPTNTPATPTNNLPLGRPPGPLMHPERELRARNEAGRAITAGNTQRRNVGAFAYGGGKDGEEWEGEEFAWEFEMMGRSEDNRGEGIGYGYYVGNEWRNRPMDELSLAGEANTRQEEEPAQEAKLYNPYSPP
ncbi:hypothetical protein BT69DRAFT_1279582 [Atractiella rhizophila]|nr:hypothetical protein BT69DRAFT_1279582 [Atractiella rhizophila]